MRIRVSMTIALAALLVLPGMLFAASPATTKPPAISVTLEYFDSPNQTFQVVDTKGNPIDPQPQVGDALQLGWTVMTGKGDVAELKMSHTGTIVKLAQNTNFTLKELRTDTGGQDVFALTLGKVRTVAGKASGKDQYQIKTQSAVCGVRGSDVVVEFEDKIFTLEGTGYIMNAAGEALDVAQGQFVDAIASFKAFEIPKDVLDGLMNEMKFTKLDVNETLDINKAWQASLQPVTPPQTATAPTPAPATAPAAPAANPFLDGIMAKLREILGMEIGSVTIGGETWSKVVIQPTFTIGALKASLYLPIIYNGDMFNPNDYYRPAGNDEWDFGGLLRPGFPSTDPWIIAGDVLTDLLLKIRYIEWGQQRDPFFFKVGNLNDITIGHGLIMRNFANDADFPAVRRVGLNLGLDFGGFGFEAMVNDLKLWPDIVGGRFYFRPIPGFKAAFGFSGIVDLLPGKDWNVSAGGPAAVGDPIFINPGLDLDLPFFDSDFFRIVAFADGAAMVPYFRSAPSTTLTGGTVVPSGFALNAIYDPSAKLPVKNWGVAAGLFGNLIIRDFTWRLEFRDYTGAFIPQFYSSGYERQRTQFVQNVLTYLGNPAAPAYDTQTLGIFGEGGLIMAKLFSLNLSYFWPWAKDAQGNFTFGNDRFVAKFALEKGVIPVVNVWGTVSYERTNFAPTIMQKGAGAGLNLFDANTVVSTTINYAVNPNIDVVLLYTTTARRDASGNIIYPTTGTALQMLVPKLDTSLAIQTQVHL